MFNWWLNLTGKSNFLLFHSYSYRINQSINHVMWSEFQWTGTWWVRRANISVCCLVVASRKAGKMRSPLLEWMVQHCNWLSIFAIPATFKSTTEMSRTLSMLQFPWNSYAPRKNVNNFGLTLWTHRIVCIWFWRLKNTVWMICVTNRSISFVNISMRCPPPNGARCHCHSLQNCCSAIRSTHEKI